MQERTTCHEAHARTHGCKAWLLLAGQACSRQPRTDCCARTCWRAPPTSQGAYQAAFFGCGYGLGALVGGFVSHAFGLQAMFGISAINVCVGGLLTQAARWYLGVGPHEINAPREGASEPPAGGGGAATDSAGSAFARAQAWARAAGAWVAGRGGGSHAHSGGAGGAGGAVHLYAPVSMAAGSECAHPGSPAQPCGPK